VIHKLEIDSVLFGFGSRKLLSDVYLKCETGKIIGLIGRNGTGKTSLFNIIYGTLTPNHKSIRLNEQSIRIPYKESGLIKYLPQYNFIPKQLTLKRIFSDFNLDFSLFEKLFIDFKTKYNSPINELSGGQRRLVEVYIIIKSTSKFILLDEPFSHLTPLLIETIKELIEEEKKNKGFLITDHLYNHIVDINNDLYLLADRKTHLIKNMKEIAFLGYIKEE